MMMMLQLPKDLELVIEFDGDLELCFCKGKFYYSSKHKLFYFIQSNDILSIEEIQPMFILRFLYNTFEDDSILHLIEETNSMSFEPYRRELLKVHYNMNTKHNIQNTKMIYGEGE